MLSRSHLLLGLLLPGILLGPTAFAASATDTAPATGSRVSQLLARLDQVKRIGPVAISPDGLHVAWLLQGKQPTIQLTDIAGHHAQALNTGTELAGCAKRDIAWAPDSQGIAFIADCGHDLTNTQAVHNDIYLVGIDNKTAPRRLAELSGYARALAWTKDGRSLDFLYVSGATRLANAVAAGKARVGVIGEGDLELQRVGSIDVASGTLRTLTADTLYVYEFERSPDGTQIAYTAAPPPGDGNWWVAKLYVQEVSANMVQRVVADPATMQGSLHGLQMALPRWSPDGARIAFIGGLMSDQGSNGGDLYSVPAAGGVVSDLTPGTAVTPRWFAWTAQDTLLVNQNVKGQVQLAAYTLSGDRASIQAPYFNLPATIGTGSSALSLSLSADHQRLAFQQSTFEQAPEVHAGTLGHTPPPAITSLNAAVKPDWGKAVSMEWTNEGHRVQGWLMYPANYDPHKTYPLIVNVHGGPSWDVLPYWPGMEAMYAASGYFQFMPNPRGSFGQGEAFVQANRKDFGYGDLRDILAGIDAVEKQAPVGDRRIGIAGASYGGFMSMFAPTQTQRFHAAVAAAGASDWQSYYGENRIDQWLIPYFGASLYDDPAPYAKSSAINFIKQAKTPTLIMVGERDEEAPPSQSFEYWHALKTLGVPTQLVVYPDEGHGFADSKHVQDYLERSMDWFAKYLAVGK